MYLHCFTSRKMLELSYPSVLDNCFLKCVVGYTFSSTQHSSAVKPRLLFVGEYILPRIFMFVNASTFDSGLTLPFNLRALIREFFVDKIAHIPYTKGKLLHGRKVNEIRNVL